MGKHYDQISIPMRYTEDTCVEIFSSCCSSSTQYSDSGNKETQILHVKMGRKKTKQIDDQN